MTSRRVLLAVAGFLDSEHALRPGGADREVQRALVSALLAAAYEDLGKAPRLLEGEDAAPLLEGLSGRLRRRDPRAEHLPAVLEAWLDHLEATEVVPHAFELRRGLDEALEPALARVRAGENEPAAQAPDAPLVHRAPKLGRNDPCFCGSGKKFKRCHGQG